ncbi:hypothetical protein DPEC_G00137180, partial [Dallia pectoralis]
GCFTSAGSIPGSFTLSSLQNILLGQEDRVLSLTMTLLCQALCLCLVLVACRAAPPNLGVMLTDDPENHKPCEQHADRVMKNSPGGRPMPGAFVPQCNEQGHYKPLQCHGSTGHCWCVDHRGQEKSGTRNGPGGGRPNCDVPGQPEQSRNCMEHKESIKTTGPGGEPVLGAFVPDCDHLGHYKPLQCHGSTGHCWCVDHRGQEKSGTRKGPGGGQPNCDVPGHPEQSRNCMEHKESIKTTGPGGEPVLGAFVPDCDHLGQYKPLQCHGSTGHCWCVNHRGQEKSGTRKGPGGGQPNCQQRGNVTEETERESCSNEPLDAVTSTDHNKTLAFRGDYYLHKNEHSTDGWIAMPINATFQGLHRDVTAAFSHAGHLYFIQGEQVFAFTNSGEQFQLVEGFPKPLKDELGIDGPLDAAFVCEKESVLHVIKGKQMFAIELTATPRVVVKEFLLPLSKYNAAVCTPKGIKVFVGGDYFEYQSPMLLAFSRIQPYPQKTSQKMFGCVF